MNAPDCVKNRSENDSTIVGELWPLTVVSTKTESFDESGSIARGSKFATPATLEIVPPSSGVTTTVITADCPEGNAPSSQSRKPKLVHDPCVAVADTKVAFSGRKWETTTWSAVSGPLFVTKML